MRLGLRGGWSSIMCRVRDPRLRRVAVKVGVPTRAGLLPVLVLLLPALCCGVWSVIMMFSSRDVVCRIGAATALGTGVMDLRRR